MTETHGWIGNWSPGIGDPTFVGWLTVVIYAVAAWQSYLVVQPGRARRNGLDAREKWLWIILIIGLLFLGFNKQLDLQSAFTELGRIMAANQGWYERRHEVQKMFIAGIGLSVIAATLLILMFSIRMPMATRISLFGSVSLLGFILIRAASFHHVDHLLGETLIGLRLNWILEIGGLIVIAFGARMRTQSMRIPS